MGPPIRGVVEQPRKETGPLVTPSYLSPLPTRSRHICDLSFSVVYCVEARPSSQLGAGPASRSRDGRPSQAQSSPRLPSLQPPLSQAGPKLWPGWTLIMEPQGLSPLLSALVYSLAHVCLMILFQVTPQSGWGLRAILLRPLSSPRPWAPGLLIHHLIEQQQWEGSSPTGERLRAHEGACALSAACRGGVSLMCTCPHVSLCVHARTHIYACVVGTHVCVHAHACVCMLVRTCAFFALVCTCACMLRVRLCMCVNVGVEEVSTHTHQSLSVFASSLLKKQSLES